MTGRLLKIGVPLAILALVITAFAAQSPQKMAELEALKAPTPTWSHPESRYDVPTADGRSGLSALSSTSTRSTSILDDTRRPSMGLAAAAQVSPGVELCGGALGGTTYDFHHNDDNQQMVAVLAGGQYAHFAWTYWDKIPDSLDAVDRFVGYNCWSTASGLGLGNCGITLDLPEGDPLKARSGFPTVDVATGDLAHVAFHARDVDEQPLGDKGMYTQWVFNAGAQCFNIFGEEQFGNASNVEEGQVIWPHIRIDLTGGAGQPSTGTDVFHMVGHPTGDGRDPAFQEQLVYYRRVGGLGNVWQGPVVLDDNAGPLNYHVAVDPTSNKCAVFYQRDDLEAAQLLQNGYLESTDNGANWIAAGAGSFPTKIEPTVGPYVSFTNYVGPEGDNPQSWLEVHGEYDNNGIKHAVWIEQIFSNLTADCRVRHWDEVNGIRTIKQAIGWDNQGTDGSRDLWLALPNLGFGDGSTTCNDGPGDLSNYNYVYVTYEQYGGPDPIEQNDVSGSDNAQNLEIYISVSNNSGATFSPSVNLTNTKSAGCDGTVPGSECSSERDPSMAHLINDTIHIIYILDTDAGDAVFGQGNWTFNPVMYYRIPGGTDANVLCPEIAPVFAVQLTNGDPDCEYHAAFNPGGEPQQQVEDLILDNFGNAQLDGVVSENPPADWLVMSVGPYSIPAGDPSNIRTVTMDATAPSVVAQGLYQTTIEITHNDPSLTANPQVLPVDFFVFDQFFCPEYATLNTGWLWLEVSNIERQGNQSSDEGGLARLDPVVGDTSYSIYDACLLIGRPPFEFDDTPGPDTVVYRNIFGEGNGQPGFRALGNLEIDTSAYGTNTGSARASALQTTVDSLIDVNVTYVFPQDPDSCEFVLIKYKITNNSGGTLTDLAVGQATDFDVTPSLNDGDSLQIQSQNTGHVDIDFNLMYQEGADTTGHIVIGDRTATRWKGGITAIQTFASPRGWIAPNDPWLFARNGGGFHEGYLWQEMVKVTGFELFPPEDPNPEEDLHTVMVMQNGLTLAHGASARYCVGYVSSNTGTDDVDLYATVRKAWRYCFGWSEFVDLDSIPTPAAQSYPYYAVGSHEGGIGGGCSGCIVSIFDNPEGRFSVSPGADPCEGTINFDGGVLDNEYSATVRVTDLCATYTDDCILKVVVGNPVSCDCPFPGDMDGNGSLNSTDLNLAIKVYFFNFPDPADPLCPIKRADINGDGNSNSTDLNLLIKTLFFNGPKPCNPCDKGNPNNVPCPS